ncbi:sensor histidine kinase [Actinophytocola xanthii]|uniref:histidine kinase n=1 Tax=Actinophytocola xanthii TaxID=1912961 RepID=A0A1Q8C4G2_9PSEU|nr:HAMP domain-containing sensor histidine kinase [Actinophytocola xanthii]OLF09237.1 two-component sensor histidine kinase [Actinophytocola xanthii]
MLVLGALLFQLLQDFLFRMWVSTLKIEQICRDNGTYPCLPYTSRGLWVRGGMFVVGFLLALWLLRRLARWVMNPVSTMTSTVRQLGPQNLAHRVRLNGPRDDLRKLADALDEMLDRMAIGFEGQRRFASNASHELRTPLAVQRTLVEVAMVTGRDDPEVNRLAAQLLLVNERNERLIEGLLVLAESDRGLPGTVPVRLDTLVSTVLDSYAELASQHGVTIHRGLVERTVQGDPVLLERLVANLVHNAVKYNDPGGTIEVVVAREPALSVHNTGMPVPAESVPALFEPFRRLTAERLQRDGAGLGLSIVRSICSAHDGTVQARPGDRGGLCVEIRLP